MQGAEGPKSAGRSRHHFLHFTTATPLDWTDDPEGTTLLDVTNLQLLEEFRKLPASDKASLLDTLWVELAAATAQSPLSDEERRALDGRLAEVAQDQRPDRDWNELRRELLRHS